MEDPGNATTRQWAPKCQCRLQANAHPSTFPEWWAMEMAAGGQFEPFPALL